MTVVDLGALLAGFGGRVPIWEALPAALVPWAILLLRATDQTLSTLRMLAVVRGRRPLAWVLGFSGALLFVTAIAGVLTTLATGWSLLAYAAGYGTGSLVGMTIEARLAPGRSLLRIFTPGSGEAVGEALRAAGMGATRLAARQQGGGELVLCYAPRREAARLRDLLISVEPGCTITSQNVRSLHGGWHA